MLITPMIASNFKGNIPLRALESNNMVTALPIFFEKLSQHLSFLHNKAHVGISRRMGGRKSRGPPIALISKTSPSNNFIKYPISISPTTLVRSQSPFSRVIPPRLLSISQVRMSSGQCVTDEADFDAILHEREFEMHRHDRSPLNRIVTSAKSALNIAHDKIEHAIKVLDINSSPIDPPLALAKELPRASLTMISPSRDMLKVISDKLVEQDVSNATTELNDLANLVEFEESSFDLVVSCYGLQSSKDPAKLIQEIHRILRPGGTMIVAIWEHLGTELIVDRILERIIPGKSIRSERSHLTKPHMLENMVEDCGLRVLDISHGQYPLYLSSADGLHGSAFDIVSLPIKKELVALMQNGERPYSFEDARAEFDDIVSEGNLVTTDSQGRLVVEDNRYKMVIARRNYEDIDRERNIRRARDSIHKASDLGSAQPNVESIKLMMNDFNSLLIDTLQHVPNSPWRCLVNTVQRDIEASGHDLSSVKIHVLDLASYPNQTTKLMARSLPKVNIHFTDLSSEGVDDMRNFAIENELENITASTMSQQRLKDFGDSSMDIVTCSFGLSRFSDPVSILREVHRVLKPGGSFIATTWDSISLERISDAILSSVTGDKEAHILTTISNLSEYSEPRKLEHMIESSTNFDILKVDHQEFPFSLGDEDSAFNNAIIPIRHLLKTMEENGVNQNAFNDARRVYQKMVTDNELMWKDDNGEVRSVRNRFKLLVARRKFEDADGILDKAEIDRHNKSNIK